MKMKVNAVFQDLCREFGWKTKLIASLLGRVEYMTMKREAKRLQNGWTHEPPTFYEMNQQINSLKQKTALNAKLIKWASPNLA